MSNIRYKEFYSDEEANSWSKETKHTIIDTRYGVSAGVDLKGEPYFNSGILIVYKVVEEK